ncbi:MULTISPECIES: M14 family zinc carboxypeptidase [Deinococcus]|uniref:M14 family zinc carboxypeptidase n=1 Tax=Deinococcus rufus TaxID=2136097 RepID=A0ABV7Z6R4_9DEIO|nr:M14 family zinc carboxypeptidase [Deinococcus sp. AB2017081]WQE96490.1 M14 family zinc carboxypeptidase [Deinococcus sp. AB2017081]
MPRFPSVLVTAALLLSACTQTPPPTTGTPGRATPLATAAECATFQSTPTVITRVVFRTDRDWTDIVKTFEPVGGTRAQRVVLLDVGQADFERLRVTAAVRGWTVSIDQAATDRANAASTVRPLSIPNYACYRTVEETYASAQALAAQYPNLATWTAIGPTWLKTRGQGGYDMYELVLTNRSTGGVKPKLMVTASIHAREYTPAELTTRFAEYLLSNYGTDADITWMLDTQEVHLVLQTNPDGRKKAEAGASWRKNVNTLNGCTTTYGVDLNRNFSFHWNSGGSSTAPCNETYMGPSAASEPETQNIQALMNRVFPDQRGPNMTDPAPADAMGVYIDVHSYSNLVLWPWGDTSTPAPNAAGLQSLGRKLAYFNGYTPEQSIGLYPTSGTTIDYAYGNLGVAAYTFELGSAFFEPCSTFTGTILPQNQAALLYALRVARAPYQLGSGADILNVSAPATVASGTTFTLSATADNTRFNTSNGAEATRTVASAEYTVDTPPWAGGTAQPLGAADGTFNAASEGVRASIPTAGLSEGRHTIYVRARNSAGGYGPVSAVFVTVTPPGTNAAPSASFTSTVSGLSATFTDTSTDTDGTIASRSWNFGDGTTSTAANPTKTYAAAGTYTVTLTVTDGGGLSSTTTRTVTVSSATTTTYTGTLARRGNNSYQPGTAGFTHAGGTITGQLTGPAGTDFDLYLQKLSGSTWSTVAQSTGSTSAENVNHAATSGTYRWRVYAYSGTGSYTLTQTR